MADTGHQTLPTHPRAWHTHIWALTWPVILANVTIPMVGVADVWVLGRDPNPALIGAAALGAAMFTSIYWLFGFLRMGTTGLVAQAYGASDRPEIAAIFVRSVSVALLLGVGMVLAQGPLSAQLFEWFNPQGEVATLARTYYDIRIYGAPGLLIYMVELGVLFGLQRMRATLILSLFLNGCNLFLDIVLVLVFDFGVAGVAWGTAISEWLAALVGFAFVLAGFKHAGTSLTQRANTWMTGKLNALFNLSSNLILRTFCVQMPFLVGIALATRIGETTLATHAVLMQLFFIMTYSLDGFAHTAETLTGYCYGARRPRDLRKASYYSAIWAFALAVLTALVYLLFADWMVALLTVAEPVRDLAAEFIPWLALAPLLCIWAFLLDGIFIGTTHIKEMRNAMLLSAIVWLAALYPTYQAWGYHGVWFAMNLFMLVRGLSLAAYYPRIERAASQ